MNKGIFKSLPPPRGGWWRFENTCIAACSLTQTFSSTNPPGGGRDLKMHVTLHVFTCILHYLSNDIYGSLCGFPRGEGRKWTFTHASSNFSIHLYSINQDSRYGVCENGRHWGVNPEKLVSISFPKWLFTDTSKLRSRLIIPQVFYFSRSVYHLTSGFVVCKNEFFFGSLP